MTIYYYETPHRHGRFNVGCDAEARAYTPKDTLICYRESDTPNGLPFITVYENPSNVVNAALKNKVLDHD